METLRIKSLRRSLVLAQARLLRPLGFAAMVLAMLMFGAWPAVVSAAQQPGAAPTEPSLQDRVVAIKTSLAQSQAKLKGYEWIETTTIFLKGEEKSRTVARCYYGAEGSVQKVSVEAHAEQKPGRGIRGRIKENKMEEMADYMKSAVELVKQYVPPQQQLVQTVVDAGNATLQIVEPGKRMNVILGNYHKPDDSISIMIDIQTNRLLGFEVQTYLDESGTPGKDPKDPVMRKVKESAFPDGTLYTEHIELEAPSKNLKVVVEHSGFRPLVTPPASGSVASGSTALAAAVSHSVVASVPLRAPPAPQEPPQA